MKKILFTFFLIICYCVKIYSQYDFSIVQKESRLPITIGADTATNWVFKISFPLIFEITNNTQDTLRFSDFQYLCDSENIIEMTRGWSASGMDYNYSNKKIECFKRRDPARLFKGKSKHTYIHTTAHTPSNDSLQQVVFMPYLDRMRKEKVTVLEIESIQDLKKKKSKLLDLFLKGDSIDFSFRDKRYFYHEIIPVEVK